MTSLGSLTCKRRVAVLLVIMRKKEVLMCWWLMQSNLLKFRLCKAGGYRQDDWIHSQIWQKLTSALYKNESAHLNQSVSLKSLNDVHVNNDQLSTLRMAHLQSGTFLLSSTIEEKHLVYSSCDLKWRKLKKWQTAGFFGSFSVKRFCDRLHLLIWFFCSPWTLLTSFKI